jgi:hypothetical protein
MARVRRLRFIPPQLPSLTDQPPEGADWIHEVKHDGYRTMLLVERGAARVHTRNGHNWSDRYPGIIATARKLPCRSAIIDGEIIVQDARGVSDFEALQTALSSRSPNLIFYAFDLLHLDGKDLRESPLVECPQDRSPACAPCQVRTWAACLCWTSFHCSARRTARGFRGQGRQTQTGASSVFMAQES